jgi:hypothetical protein
LLSFSNEDSKVGLMSFSLLLIIGAIDIEDALVQEIILAVPFSRFAPNAMTWLTIPWVLLSSSIKKR